MNILITSIGNKTNLIKYFRRALHNEGGGRLIGMDSSLDNNGRHFTDLFLLSPKVSDPNFESWFFAQIELHRIGLVVPSRDEDLMVLASLRERAQTEFACRILVPERQVLDLCLDKEKFGDWCLQHHFHVARRYDQDAIVPAMLPLFIKPKIASGSRGIVLVNDWQQWTQLKVDLGTDVLIQEYIDAPEYSVDTFVDRNGKVVSVVPRKRLLTLHGESIHAEVDLDRQIIREVSRLASELGLVAHNTIQCFKQQDRVIMSEVNARYGGGFTLGVEAGADTPRYLLQEQHNKPLSADQSRIINGFTMYRIQKDLFGSPVQVKRTYCFDLDGTLCTESCRYEDAQPIAAVVDKVNRLYAQGHQIVIATARGAASGKCWRSLIVEQLAQWGVQYHRLVTEKPFADYYVDNKSVDVLEFL